MWENTVEHAKTCVLGGKVYVYFTDETHSTGAVFNNIYELRGLIADEQFLPLESLTHNQKVGVSFFLKILVKSTIYILSFSFIGTHVLAHIHSFPRGSY